MRILVPAALAAIAFGSVAAAQTPAPDGGRGSGDRARRWQEHVTQHDAMAEATRRRRADDIALLIGLRADQRPGFDAMLAAMEPPHRAWTHDADGGKPAAGMPMADETMATRLDHMAAHIDERSAAEKAKITALRTFYAGLSADQRTRFDALDRLRHDHDGMGMHGGDGHGGPGGPPPMR